MHVDFFFQNDMEEKIAVVSKKAPRRPSNVVISWRCWLIVRILAAVAIFLLLLLAIALAITIVIKTTPPYCPSGLDNSGRNLAKPGIFSDLSPKEMIAVRDYLLGQKRLGLTPFASATVNSSYIYMITLQNPLKDAVIKFQKGAERKPSRAAKVTVYRGNTEPPRIDEFLVGPLPKPTYHRLVTSPAYRRVPVPFTSRPVDAIERAQLKSFLYKVTEELHDLFRESYGLTYHNCTPHKDCIMFEDFAPRGTSSGERMTWYWAYRETVGFYLHPLGFAIQIDHHSPFPSTWTVSRLIYNGQLFYEIEDLVERYKEGTLRKIKNIMDNVDAQFSTFSKRGHQSFDSPLRGPRLIEPEGHRYSIEDQFVQYFGWAFTFHMKSTTGLQIMDLYFQGESIAYEISLQDITAFYTGYSPETSWLGLYGLSWLLGASSYELVPGVDCPGTATFIDAFHFANTDTPLRFKNSICVFEQTSSVPLRRHYSHSRDGKFQSYGGLVASSLVVRTIISLWSCDYILDYVFHLDGTMEMKISLTGYIQASYDLAGQRPYGNRIHNSVRGNLHQHLFHWKIDLDIESLDNRYQTLDMTTEFDTSFWYESTLNKTQLKFQASLKEDEAGASVAYDFDQPQHHIIYNMLETNKFGTSRGYRIVNKDMSKFLLQDSVVTNAASWARYQMAVTKYKDTEDSSSSIFAQGDPFDPVLDFSRYLEDNDTIVDTDIVAWVTSGLYHIPHAEDVPSISTAANQCSVMLIPYNFFDHCPSMAVSDALLIGKKQKSADVNAERVFNSFGTDISEPKCYQKETSTRSFHGDVEAAEV
ncbi:amiloride-sensitive amine oxidase [copper-containing] [Biomphalaria glabrata]|nr:amiloride-sensitive amine oxidase [copper-containing] [Biomphalaria glabrata]